MHHNSNIWFNLIAGRRLSRENIHLIKRHRIKQQRRVMSHNRGARYENHTRQRCKLGKTFSREVIAVTVRYWCYYARLIESASLLENGTGCFRKKSRCPKTITELAAKCSAARHVMYGKAQVCNSALFVKMIDTLDTVLTNNKPTFEYGIFAAQASAITQVDTLICRTRKVQGVSQK